MVSGYFFAFPLSPYLTLSSLRKEPLGGGYLLYVSTVFLRARCVFTGCQVVIASEIGQLFRLLWFPDFGPRQAMLIGVCPALLLI